MRKIIPIIRWVIVMLANGLSVGVLTVLLLLAKWIGLDIDWLYIFISLGITTFVMFPLLYPFRDFITNKKIKPFWYYFDEEDGYYGNNKFLNNEKRKPTNWFNKFILAYKWNSFRNPAWNWQASLKPKDGYKIVYGIPKGELKKNGNTDISVFEFAVIKYVDENGKYQDNFGPLLSLKYSIIGKMLTWYKVGKTLYFRYSYVKEVDSRFVNFIFSIPYNIVAIFSSLPIQVNDHWIEFQIGTSDARYTWRSKVKRNPIIYEELNLENTTE